MTRKDEPNKSGRASDSRLTSPTGEHLADGGWAWTGTASS
ncbi:hypothetical protein SAMN05216266_101800 [Amycolatopsis marina]|uniref:Uncharacterized protein n=1 Tax=Amycolatopsis marina TaxID=490629 RepID=A0A1I0W7C5_9PSEU|nr:hypothetical protein SAMN05216266_101800 [Amycolatopsis marina]